MKAGCIWLSSSTCGRVRRYRLVNVITDDGTAAMRYRWRCGGVSARKMSISFTQIVEGSNTAQRRSRAAEAA